MIKRPSGRARTVPWAWRAVLRWAVLTVVLLLPAWSALAGEDEAKFHPGHYVSLAPYADGPDAMTDAARPGVAGVQKRYTWRELEPRPGDYDFSGIARDLALMNGLDRQLVVFVCDKSFKDQRSTPRYLWDDYTLPVSSLATGRGFVAKRWDPYVVERFSRLLEAMGEAFDSHPRFEGVAIQETALGVDDAVLDANGYSPARYSGALEQQLESAAAAFPSSRVFWYVNFMPGDQAYLVDVAAAVASPRVALGGPDVLPGDWSLERHVYPLLRKLKGHAVLFNSIQYSSYRHRRPDGSGYYSPLELLRYARDDLGVSYLFWNRVQYPKPRDSYGIRDAYPVIAAHPLEGPVVE